MLFRIIPLNFPDDAVKWVVAATGLTPIGGSGQRTLSEMYQFEVPSNFSLGFYISCFDDSGNSILPPLSSPKRDAWRLFIPYPALAPGLYSFDWLSGVFTLQPEEPAEEPAEATATGTGNNWKIGALVGSCLLVILGIAVKKRKK